MVSTSSLVNSGAGLCYPYISFKSDPGHQQSIYISSVSTLSGVLMSQLSYLYKCIFKRTQFRSVTQSWTAAQQASLSITNSWSLLKLMSIELVMPSNHFILCRPLLLLPSIFPSIRVFSKESVLCIRWPKYWSFIFSISPSNEYSGLIFLRMDWFELLAI